MGETIPSSRYYWSKLKAWMVFDDTPTKEIPVSNVELRFPLDGIPTAVIRLAVGRDSNGNVAGSHKEFHVTSMYRKISVMFRGRAEPYTSGGDAASAAPRAAKWPTRTVDGTPSNDVVIFEGYVSSTGYTLANGSLAFTIGAKHWLVDMCGSSTITRTFSSPYELGGAGPPKFPANLPAGVKADAIPADSSASYTSSQTLRDMCLKATVADIWPVLLEVYTYMTSDAIWPELGIGVGDPTKSSNEPALKALKKINVAGGPAAKVPTIEFGPEVRGMINDALGEAIADNVHNTWRSSNMWESLQLITREFLVHVVPCVSHAYVVPINPMLRDVKQTLFADEYTVLAEALEATEEPTCGVKLLPANVGEYTAGTAAFGSASNWWYYGYYVIEELRTVDAGKRAGAIRLFQSPSWLKGNDGSGKQASKSTNIVYSGAPQAGSDGDLPVDTYSGGENTDGVQPYTEDNVEAKKVLDPDPVYTYAPQADPTNLGCRYAKALLLHLLFGKRVVTLGGRLRFDIAPGTAVRVQGLSGKLQEYETEDMWGMVAETRISINVGEHDGSASTSFVITHLRVEAEQKNTWMTSEKHPVFLDSDVWQGCALMTNSGG